MKKALIFYALNNKNESSIFDFLESINEFTIKAITAENIDFFPFLARIKLNWNERSKLFEKLLNLKHNELSSAVFSTNNSSPAHNQNYGTVGIVDIGPIEPYIEWLVGVRDQRTRNQLSNNFGYFILFHTDIQTQDKFVQIFDKSSDVYKDFLTRWVLNLRRDLLIDDFNSESQEFLLSDLNRANAVSSYYGHMLEHISTEDFTTNRILPLLQEASGALRDNLIILLRRIGAKYGKRYFL